MILQTLLKLGNELRIERKEIHDFRQYGVRKKTHDFRKYKPGEDFFVDFFNSYNSAKMVSSIFVRPGERVIFQEQKSNITYRVTEVEYYSNSSRVQEVSLKIDPESEFQPSV